MIENIEEKQAEAPVPGSPDYPLHSELTIGAYLKQQVAIDPDHEFVVYPDRDLRWTYKDFDERTDALAKGLLAIGMKPGDHLGVWARNIPDWLTFMYASAKIGVVMVTVNPVYKSHELDYVLKQSDMKALCVIDAYRDVDYLKIIRDLVPVSATAKSAERATLSRRRRPRFPAGGATALWPPALPRAAAQGALDRGVVEVRGPDLNLQRRGALGVPGRDRPARDLPSAELREPDRHRDVLCAERGQPPRGVRGPHDCPLSGSPSPSAASASRSFMR